VNVTAAGIKSRVAALHITAHRREADGTHWRRLEVLVIGVGAENHRETLGGSRAVDIPIEEGAIRHAYLDIPFHDDVVLSFRSRPLGCEHELYPPYAHSVWIQTPIPQAERNVHFCLTDWVVLTREIAGC
jgi:hypothetical protein